jgi:SAM-dependent methyltransferase
MGERMSVEEINISSSSAYGHKARYHLAAGYLRENDCVLDAACGIGYGADILSNNKEIYYYGVDREISTLVVDNINRTFIRADLLTWEPEFEFDVFVGYETVEHLQDYSNYLQVAKKAKRLIFLSVPVIPTKHMNPWHLHDFEPGELVRIVEDKNWNCIQALGQPSEFSEIYIFEKIIN